MSKITPRLSHLQQTPTHGPAPAGADRSFSLATYLAIVFALSWPFQIAFVLWRENSFLSFSLSSLSMVMVTVGTFIAGRYVFRDGFADAGWRWGRPRQYAAVFGLAAFVWVLPTLIEQMSGMRGLPADLSAAEAAATFFRRFIPFFFLTLIPGFGEEFGWRGYMLPRLARRMTTKKALLLHGFIWWAWHLPVLIGLGAATADVSGGVALGITITLLFSLLPSMMHAVVFAYIWSSTQSLAVATVYHAAFDEMREAAERSVGFGPFVDLIWQNAVLLALGAFLLWKGNWSSIGGRGAGAPSLEEADARRHAA